MPTTLAMRVPARLHLQPVAPPPATPAAPSAPPAPPAPPSPDGPADAAPPGDPAPSDPPAPASADGTEQLTPEEMAWLAEQEAAAEVIVVTGSAIGRRELTTPAPVTVLDKSDLEAAGLATVGDVLQNLPAQSNGINIQFNNGGDGSTRVDLRGLGAARTLVLLNGRRVVAGGLGADSSVDLNAIPLAIIERVEVLKDGASAVYGSDAIGGVVNIITRNDFQGQEATVYTGSTQRGDGAVYDLSFVTGATSASKKANIVVSAGYSEVKPVWAGDRQFSRVDRDIDWETGEVGNVGSTATPGGFLVTDEDGDGVPETGNAEWDALVAGCPSGVCTRNGDTGDWRDFIDDGSPNDFYNFQPENYLVTPLQRYNVFSTGSYQLHDRARAFFETTYMNRKSEQSLAPEPLLLDQTGLVISADSVYNPYGRDIAFYRRRLVEMGRRQFFQNVDTFRLVTGLDGKLGDGDGLLDSWTWELSFNYGRTQGQNINAGNLVLSRVAEALGPSYLDANGVARCGTTAQPGNPDCVPLDLLGGRGSITPEMAAYLTYTGIAGGINEQRTFLATARGQVAKTPWNGDVAVALGADYRQEAGSFLPDPLTATGDTTGNAQEPTAGDYDVVEGFGEISIVPVTRKGFAEWVEISAAARAFRYSTFGSGLTWKSGALFRTSAGVALRGTYSTAFRSPSIAELYSGQADSFPPLRDPCDTSDGPLDPIVAEQCAAEGVPSNYVNPVTQLRTKVGGNPALQSETAKTLTAGVVVEPTFAKGLALTVDYFRIRIDNAIQSVGADVILSNCYSQPAHTDCDKVVRRPGTFVIDYVEDLETNIGGNATSGVDVAVAYDHEVPAAGRFRHQIDATYLLRYNERNALRTLYGLGVYDLGVFPRLKTNVSTIWARGAVGAGANVRFIGGFRECEDNDCNSGKPERDVDSNLTADVFASYQVKSEAGTTSISLGVNNVLDQAPPVIFNGFLGDSDASTYDYLGRYIYLRATQAF